MADTVRVALFGAGRTGTPLLKEFLKYKYITLVGVADHNPRAAGIRLAAKQGIFTTTKPMEVLKKTGDVDIIIEVTGDKKLKKQLKTYLLKTKNKRTIIMHDLIARLFISVCTKKSKLIPSLHPEDIGIGA
ncbi:MAG: hypothetical protein M0Z79_12695 [Nitrospiraceae bacterium]|nr:hypothetical protein [Nitrospiraceae bacterium]